MASMVRANSPPEATLLSGAAGVPGLAASIIVTSSAGSSPPTSTPTIARSIANWLRWPVMADPRALAAPLRTLATLAAAWRSRRSTSTRSFSRASTRTSNDCSSSRRWDDSSRYAITSASDSPYLRRSSRRLWRRCRTSASRSGLSSQFSPILRILDAVSVISATMSRNRTTSGSNGDRFCSAAITEPNTSSNPSSSLMPPRAVCAASRCAVASAKTSSSISSTCSSLGSSSDAAKISSTWNFSRSISRARVLVSPPSAANDASISVSCARASRNPVKSVFANSSSAARCTEADNKLWCVC